MKTKKLNYENGISYLITSSKDSYATLAKKLTKNLDSGPAVTERKVKDWAHGALPFDAELNAIVKYSHQQESNKFSQISNWKELFFPSTDFTLKFIKHTTLTQAIKVLNSTQIDKFIKNRNLGSLYNGLDNKDTSLNTLTSILLMKIYLNLRSKDIISDTSIKDYSFVNYRKQIIPYLKERFNNIPYNSVFVQDAMASLKNVLVKNGTNRANIRKKAIKQVISII